MIVLYLQFPDNIIHVCITWQNEGGPVLGIFVQESLSKMELPFGWMNILSLLSFVSVCFNLHILQLLWKDRYAIRSTITCILSSKKTIP